MTLASGMGVGVVGGCGVGGGGGGGGGGPFRTPQIHQHLTKSQQIVRTRIDHTSGHFSNTK